MKIGILSDTHGVFDKPLRDFLEPCDQLWHAGDFGGGFGTAAEIAAFKPLTGVVGNCDERGLMYDYPLYKYFTCEDLGILMTHIGGYPGHYDIHARQLIERYRPHVFVCGHSHILRVMRDDHYDMTVINPGAAGLQGFHIIRTAIRLNVNGSDLSGMEVLNLER